MNAGFGLKATGLRVQGGAERHQRCRGPRGDEGRVGDGGKVLGITPSVPVGSERSGAVPPALEDPALRLINSEFGTGGCANPWKDRRMSPMPRSLSRASRRVTAAMARLDLATCEAALPPGDAPEWVHLLPPKGRITARDGRQFVARESCGFACRKSCGFAVDDPARLVADSRARGGPAG